MIAVWTSNTARPSARGKMRVSVTNQPFLWTAGFWLVLLRTYLGRRTGPSRREVAGSGVEGVTAVLLYCTKYYVGGVGEGTATATLHDLFYASKDARTFINSSYKPAIFIDSWSLVDASLEILDFL